MPDQAFFTEFRTQYQTLDLGVAAFNLIRIIGQMNALDHRTALQRLGGTP